MKLSNEFYKLPFQFDVEKLVQEISVFDESEWFAHHENFRGNSAIPLVSVGGTNNNLFKGAMAETDALKQSPYMRQVISSFGEVVGRSRLMRLAPRCEVPLHSDINYHWFNRVRIHVPIVTDPNVIFFCGDKQVHMKAGECWIFDSWRFHRVFNGSDVLRVHLVVDVTGSSQFWQMVKHKALKYEADNISLPHSRFISYESAKSVIINTEKFNFPLVMHPGEVDGLVEALKADIHSCETNNVQKAAVFCESLDYFKKDWRQLWSQYGTDQEGWPMYHRLRDNIVRYCTNMTDVKLVSGHTAISVLTHLIAAPCLNADMIIGANA